VRELLEPDKKAVMRGRIAGGAFVIAVLFLLATSAAGIVRDCAHRWKADAVQVQ